MARGDKSKLISDVKEKAVKKQKQLQSAGLSKRSAENRAWDLLNKTEGGTTGAGTSGGRSKVSKRTTTPSGSTRKGKTTGKTRK